MDIMRQSAYLVVNPLSVYTYGFLFNCTTVGHTSDFMMALALVSDACLSLGTPWPSSRFSLARTICEPFFVSS